MEMLQENYYPQSSISKKIKSFMRQMSPTIDEIKLGHQLHQLPAKLAHRQKMQKTVTGCYHCNYGFSLFGHAVCCYLIRVYLVIDISRKSL